MLTNVISTTTYDTIRKTLFFIEQILPAISIRAGQILSDDDTSIRIVVWGMSAVNCLKLINMGDTIELSKVIVKFNDYTGEKEVTFG